MTTTSGLLLLDKPTGLTSHDVVARVRRALKEKRVGHAGTLDPMATGLLVIAVGPATRLLRFAQGEDKRYEGTVLFGVATDSLDADGEVVERREVPALDVDLLNAAAGAMLGDQPQTPPMVSALKVGGKRLHELARAGVEVERAPRAIRVARFSMSPGSTAHEWRFDVECSVGTYVRVLLSDLATSLGTLGHLTSLRRRASGGHRVEDALTLEAFERRAAEGAVTLAPPRDFVTSLVAVVVSDDVARRLRLGQRVPLDVDANEVAVVDDRGELIAVAHRRGDAYQPDVVLPAGDARDGQ